MIRERTRTIDNTEEWRERYEQHMANLEAMRAEPAYDEDGPTVEIFPKERPALDLRDEQAEWAAHLRNVGQRSNG